MTDEQRRIYPRPPIVEAMVEFVFQEDVVSPSLYENLGEALKTQYPGPRDEQKVFEVSANLTPGEMSAKTEIKGSTIFLKASDSLRLIGCAARVLSIHVLRPYPGWESFEEQITQAVGALSDETRDRVLEKISVRYIDRFDLPASHDSIDTFLAMMPPCPTGLPGELAAFNVVTETADSDGTAALLIMAGGANSETSAFRITYDLTLQRVASTKLSDSEWLQIVRTLHVRQRAVFEASITDVARELFQ